MKNKDYLKKAAAMAFVCLAALPTLADGLVPKANEKGDRFGFADASGKFVIKPSYDQVAPFTDGFAIVRKGNVFGTIDERGKEIIPIKYNVLERVDDNVMMVAVDGHYKDGLLVGEKYGFLSTDGTEIVKPEYIDMSPFNTFGVATITDKKGKTGLLNRKYEFALPPEFTYIAPFNSLGMTWANIGGRLSDNKIVGGKYYILDSNGNYVVEGAFPSLGYYIPYSWRPDANAKKTMSDMDYRLWNTGNSYHFWRRANLNTTVGTPLPTDIKGWWASSRTDGRYNGVYALDGTLLIPEKIFWFASFPEDGVCVVSDKEGSYNFVSMETGKPILTSNVDSMWGFQDGYAVCGVRGLQYIVDNKGAQISQGYQAIFPRNGDMHVIKTPSGYGLIDYRGNVIVPPTATNISHASPEGLSLVTNSRGTGYANATGYVIQPDYIDGFPFANGYAWVKDLQGWTLINAANVPVTSERFHSGMLLGGKAARFWGQKTDSGPWECYDLATGMKVFDKGFGNAYNYGVHYDGLALVAHPEHPKLWGIIDMDGNEVLPMSFGIDQIHYAYAEFLARGSRPWTASDTFFFNVRTNPARNGFSINQIIQQSFWDF